MGSGTVQVDAVEAVDTLVAASWAFAVIVCAPMAKVVAKVSDHVPSVLDPVAEPNETLQS